MPILCRKLFLEGLRIPVSIGIHEHEKRARQIVSIDIELELSDPTAPARDDIADVLDYDFLRAEVSGLVADQHFNLQESLCHAIVEIIAKRTEVARARVATRKPDVYPDCEAVGYEVVYEA